MTVARHGLSIGMERSGSDFYMTITAIGRLTHADYEVVVPVIEAALTGVSSPTIRALVDAREMEGWEPRAAWDDFKLGVQHGHEFGRIALVGTERWQQLAATIGGWFISGESRCFDNMDEAIGWLKS